MQVFNTVFFDRIEDWVALFIKQQAYLAPILLLTLEESGIPLPVPGDLIIIYTGYEIAKGIIPYVIAFIIILIAVLLGSSILYFLSAKYGESVILQFGKYIDLDKKKLSIVQEKFKKYGPIVIILGRHIPGFRIPITVFSGMSGVSYRTFIVSTFISVVFWIGINLSIGQKLGPKAAQLLHTHQKFYLLGFIPLILTISWWLFMVYKAKKADKK